MDPTFMPRRSLSMRTAIRGKKAVAGVLPRICRRESVPWRTRVRRKVAKARGTERTTARPTPMLTRRKLRKRVHGIPRATGARGRAKANCQARQAPKPTPAAKAAAETTASTVEKGPGRFIKRAAARKDHWPKGATTDRE